MKLLLPSLVLALLSSVAAPAMTPQERQTLLSQPLKTLVLFNGQRFVVEGEVVVDGGRLTFRSRDRALYSLSLDDLDPQRTAAANGITFGVPDRSAVQQPEEAPREKKKAADVALRAISTIGLTGREGERPDSREPAAPRRDDRWTFFTGFTSAAESNINHDPEPVADYGLIPSAGINFRSRGERATLEASYAAAAHSYTETDAWDRVSHHLQLSYEPRWKGRWRSEMVGEISLKGSNEDRDLSDRYIVSHRLKFRLNEASQLRLNTGYRRKLYDDDPGANAHNPYAGVDYRRGFSSGVQWNAGYRWETNIAETERRRYDRTTLFTEVTIPVSQKSDLRAGLRYREQFYPERVVRDVEARPLRRDHRWLGSVSWTRSLFDHIALAVDYLYEERGSNEPDKEFDSHGVSVSVIRYW